MDMLMKYAFRQVMGWLAQNFQGAAQTETKVDDYAWAAAHNALRAVALQVGFIDAGGPDDPGEIIPTG